MGKSPEGEPEEIAVGIVKELPERDAAVAHVVSNSIPLVVKMAKDIARKVGAEVVVMEETTPQNPSLSSFFGQINWDGCTSKWTPSGSAWASQKPGHA